MTEFKKGDIVICHDDTHSHGQLKVGEEYTISRLDSVYVMLEGFVGRYRPDRFKLKVHLPLYSEETAKAFLEERGYKVQPPPEPLKGKIYVYLYNGKRPITRSREILHKMYKLIAIVDWAEGQGLEND